MKANETPEKIYIANNVFPSHIDWDGAPINSKRIDKTDIEYTRTDAFINKACEWLEKNIAEATGIDSYAITESFKQAMEE